MEPVIKDREPLHPVMLAGTGSDVGKSVLCTALCRIFLQDGYNPAPFKAQNMALNSAVTPDGGEIGRAQAVQAEACRLVPTTDMNPLLLKPNSDHTSQVVLCGHPIGTMAARDYYRSEGREHLRRAVCESFDRLRSRYNPVVLEGAGSIAELNLKEQDLVNMWMARQSDADVILVADIERGGVFASIYGSIMLQKEEDRKRIKGVIVNKFRGDIHLFDEGRRIIEQLCQVPVLGVVPVFSGISIDEEDSMALEKKARTAVNGMVNIAVVRLPHISNYTDFEPLEHRQGINLYYTMQPDQLQQADIIILPGTKSTLSDLQTMRESGVSEIIKQAYERDGKTIVGICGGFQMLGRTISDPYAIEGTATETQGLALLPVDTVMQAEKQTRLVQFQWNGIQCHGYEIHHGRSTTTEPLIIETEHCLGTYLHGLFDNPTLIDHVLSKMANRVEPMQPVADQPPVSRFREQQYDLLADHVRKYVDIAKLYQILTHEP